MEDYFEFLASCFKRYCPWCGKPIIDRPHGRHREYCSDPCRWAANKYRQRMRAG